MVPEGWQLAKTGDIARSIVPGRNKPKSFTGDIPWITMPTMTGRFVPSVSHDLFVSKEELSDAGGKVVPTNSVIMSCVGELGIVTRNSVPVVLNQQLHAFVPNDNIDSAFLAYQLANSRAEMLARASKTTIPYLNKSNCEALPVLLPPLPEQKKIAEILFTWDKAIETTGRLLADAEAQKRALMQQLLTGKRRLNGFVAREWERHSLDVVFERVRRKNTLGNQNVLTISGKEGLVSQRKYFSKLVAAADTSGYTLLRGGDFAYNKSYSAGYPLGAIKMLPMGETGVLSSLYICFHLRNKERDCADFYRHWFEFGGLNRELSVVAQEGARNHGLLNVGVLEFFDLLISRPEAEEQREIAALLNAAELQANNTELQLRRLELEKRALMQQILTGTRRVAV